MLEACVVIAIGLLVILTGREGSKFAMKKDYDDVLARVAHDGKFRSDSYRSDRRG